MPDEPAQFLIMVIAGVCLTWWCWLFWQGVFYVCAHLAWV